MNEQDFDFRNHTGTWQTGRTQPPRRYRGLICILLVLVILLSGISTALSIMNLKLQRKLTDSSHNSSVSFSRSTETIAPIEEVHEEVQFLQDHLNISGTLIPEVYQRYYKLPSGIYVSRVADSSEAQEKGIIAGDIITGINGYTVHNNQALDLWANAMDDGDTVELVLYRSGSEISVTLTWHESN